MEEETDLVFDPENSTSEELEIIISRFIAERVNTISPNASDDIHDTMKELIWKAIYDETNKNMPRNAAHTIKLLTLCLRHMSVTAIAKEITFLLRAM